MAEQQGRKSKLSKHAACGQFLQCSAGLVGDDRAAL